MEDLIKPSHYLGLDGETQALDVIANFQPDNYNLGTALTYLLRAGKKVYVNDSKEDSLVADLKKAISHLEDEVSRIDTDKPRFELAEGNYYRVIGNTSPMHWFKNGQIVKLVSEVDSRIPDHTSSYRYLSYNPANTSEKRDQCINYKDIEPWNGFYRIGDKVVIDAGFERGKVGVITEIEESPSGVFYTVTEENRRIVDINYRFVLPCEIKPYLG